MNAWTEDELKKIGTAEELQITSTRKDGSSRKPVTIWVVRVGDELFVRSVRGKEGDWYRGTQVRHEGHIQAGGVDKDVLFEAADAGMNEKIDAAYRSKYHRYAANIVNSILTPQARATTIRLVPS